MTVCFLLGFVVGTEACQAISDPHLITLPSSKALWEAKSRWAWELEYDVAEAKAQAGQPTFHTVGDLALAQLSGAGGVGMGRGSSDLVDDWHADLDGLGMLLAAVIAAV